MLCSLLGETTERRETNLLREHCTDDIVLLGPGFAQGVQCRVREYRLQLNYRFRVVNAKGQILVPPNDVSLSRDITFDDSNVLAKDLEEGLLWRDMNNDLVNQIMRRLSIIKPKNPDLEEDE